MLSLVLSIASIALSVISLIFTVYHNHRLVKINENTYRLSWELSLLKRKEEHFNELKERVILPLLYKRYRDKFSTYLFRDMITNHYLDLGAKLRSFAKLVLQREELRKLIASRILNRIKGFSSAHGFEINVTQWEIEENLELIRRRGISVNVDRSGKEYCTYLQARCVYRTDSEENAKRVKMLLEAVLNEIYNDREVIDNLEKLHRLELDIAAKQRELRKELKKLLEKPPKSLRLVNNQMCPYMKGEENEEPTDEDRRIAEILLKELPEEEEAELLTIR